MSEICDDFPLEMAKIQKSAQLYSRLESYF